MNETLAALIEAVQLREVRVIDAAFHVASAATLDQTKITVHTETAAKLEDSALVVNVKLAVAGSQKSVERPVVECTCTVEVSYHLPREFTTDQDTASAFAEVNGLFNAWPYARTFIQNSFSAMGLPPFALPVLRVKDLIRTPPKKATPRKVEAL